jgi:predicted nucleotidyltransferase
MVEEGAFEKARQYVSLAREVIPLHRAVLFGSYASGNPDSDSDIDIGLFVDDIDSDVYINTLAKLQSLCRQIDLNIEPHLFISGEDRSGFASWVSRTGILIEI